MIVKGNDRAPDNGWSERALWHRKIACLTRQDFSQVIANSREWR